MVTASCSGVLTAKVTHWWALRSPSDRAAGATAQPIFHPVTEKVFPALPRVMARSPMPGRTARRQCSRPSKTMRS